MPIEITLNELVKDINETLGYFRKMLTDENKDNSDFLLFSPEEWKQIGITIAHVDLAFINEHKCQTQEEADRWAHEHIYLFAYVRDMAMCWYERLHNKGEA